ncbi:MAG: hypothetical protein JWM09_568 [Francisellaceae bacterium]|nr:hypothetical protein [Francisellaceae bacterium]
MRNYLAVVLFVFSSSLFACEKHERISQLMELSAQAKLAHQTYLDNPNEKTLKEWSIANMELTQAVTDHLIKTTL